MGSSDSKEADQSKSQGTDTVKDLDAPTGSPTSNRGGDTSQGGASNAVHSMGGGAHARRNIFQDWAPFQRPPTVSSPTTKASSSAEEAKSKDATTSPKQAYRPFLGLENYGNTCYCNSITQLLLHSEPLRDRLKDIYAQFYDPALAKAGSGASSSVVSASAITSPSASMRLPLSPDDSILGRFAELCHNSEVSKKKKGALAPRHYVQKYKSENYMFKNSMQQDAHEFCIFIINDIIESEKKLLGLEMSQKGPIQKLFEGHTVAETVCTECETVTTRPEPFVALSIDVEENTSLKQCFANFSTPEYLTGEDRYKCMPCTSPTVAKRSIKLQTAPPLLLVHLKRFKYIEGQQAFRKLSYRIPFPDQLGLRFLSSKGEKLGSGSKSPREGHGTGSDDDSDDDDSDTDVDDLEFLVPPASTVGNSSFPSAATAPLGTDGNGADPSIATSSWANRRRSKGALVHYRLVGFVVHHGAGPNVGHYIACCRTEAGGSVWRKFDDETVTVLSDREAQLYFGYATPNGEPQVTSTAYILLFVRV